MAKKPNKPTKPNKFKKPKEKPTTPKKNTHYHGERHNAWRKNYRRLGSHAARQAFLKAIVKNYGFLKAAARQCRIDYHTVTDERRRDPEFDAEVIAARVMGGGGVESRVVRLINAGSATMIVWALKKLFPEEYGDKETHELTGAKGGPVAVETAHAMSPDERRAEILNLIDVLRERARDSEAAEAPG